MATLIQLPLPSGYSLRHRPIDPAMTHRVLQCLTRLVQPLRASPGLGAFALPPEIISVIASHLNNSSMTSLALTCRSLHGLCFPGHLLLDMAEKGELLLLLEKDVPTHCFCHYCVKLHRWHGRWSRSIFPWYEHRMHCKRSAHSYPFLPATHSIACYHARLIMNRHFYGPTHGPSLHNLERRARSYYHADGVVESMS